MFSNVYLNNIATACVAFPLVACVITLPYLIYQYRRYGSVPWWRTFVVYLFVLYLMAAYCLVILPLPVQDVYVPYAAVPQLTPFSFVGDIAAQAHLTADPATWLAAIKAPAVYEALFNVLLTMPFGFFLRYYFNRRWYQVLCLGFLWTLFFEVSQLTGLFGLYEHPYRLFDVDDLIANTFGAMAGFWLALALARVLPDMDEVNQEAWEKGSRATLTRRVVSFATDVVIASFLSALAGSAWGALGAGGVEHQAAETLVFAACFMLVPALPGSATLGQRILRLRIVAPDGGKAAWWRRGLRYFVLYALVVAVPAALVGGLPAAALAADRWIEPSVSAGALIAVLILGGLIWVISLAVRAVRSAMGHPFVMLNGLITGTRIAPAARGAHERTPWRERLKRKRS